MNSARRVRTDLLIRMEFVQSIDGTRHVRRYVIRKADILPGPLTKVGSDTQINIHNSRDGNDAGINFSITAKRFFSEKDKEEDVRVIECVGLYISKAEENDPAVRNVVARLETLISNRLDTRLQYVVGENFAVTPNVTSESVASVIMESQKIASLL